MNKDGKPGIFIRGAVQMTEASWALYEAIWQIITGNGYLFNCELRTDGEGKVHLFVPKQSLKPEQNPALELSTPAQREKLGFLGEITSRDFIRRSLLHDTGVTEVEPNLYVHTFKVFRVVNSDEGDALYIEDPLAKEMSQRPPRPPRRQWGKRR